MGVNEATFTTLTGKEVKVVYYVVVETWGKGGPDPLIYIRYVCKTKAGADRCVAKLIRDNAIDVNTGLVTYDVEEVGSGD